MDIELRDKFKDNICNVPEHKTVKDRVIWHLKEDTQKMFGISLKHERALEAVEAFIEAKRAEWPTIDEQMAKGPCTKYEDRAAGRFMHQVEPFARDYLEKNAGMEFKKVDYRTHDFY